MSFKNDLEKLLKYLWPSEQKSCEEYVDNGGKKKDHIFPVIERLDSHQEMVLKEYYALGIINSEDETFDLSYEPYNSKGKQKKSKVPNRFDTIVEAINHRKKQGNKGWITILHIQELKI